MTAHEKWTRQQLLVAFSLYCELPFGKLDSKTPQVKQYAKLIGRTPGALAMKLSNIASLDPVITQTGRTGLSGSSAADRAMWNEMQNDWQGFAVASHKALCSLGLKDADVEMSSDDASQAAVNYQGESVMALVSIRIGQTFFRKSVLSAYDYRCCISGLSVPTLLVASHIIPWRSDPSRRLNPSNGLCLSALHDKAFDNGLITLSSALTVQVSKNLKVKHDSFLVTSLLAYENQPINLPAKFRPDEACLEFHRHHVFQK